MSNDLQAVRQQNFTLNFFDKDQMDSIQRGAKMLANSDLVPDIYKVSEKNPLDKAMANCIIALEMSQRIGASPLMIMQNMIIIYGRPSWSSTFLIATVNTCGRFEPLKFQVTNKGKIGKISYIDYEWVSGRKQAVKKEFDGTKIDNLECVAWTRERGAEDVLKSTPIDLKMAIQEGWYTKAGSKWQTMAEQMLRYRTASFWTKAYAPEISMGMQTTEELKDSHHTEDISYEMVDERVEKELNQKANGEEIAIDEEPEKVDPNETTQTPEDEKPKAKNVTASPEIAFPESSKPKF